MAELISISEEKAPRVICPHCKEETYIDLTPWTKDCTKIMQDKCPKCRGTIFAGIMILCHQDLQSLLACIRKAVEAMSGSNQILGGKRIH